MWEDQGKVGKTKKMSGTELNNGKTFQIQEDRDDSGTTWNDQEDHLVCTPKEVSCRPLAARPLLLWQSLMCKISEVQTLSCWAIPGLGVNSVSRDFKGYSAAVYGKHFFLQKVNSMAFFPQNECKNWNLRPAKRTRFQRPEMILLHVSWQHKTSLERIWEIVFGSKIDA